jgi:hypothetical protein
MVSLLQPLVFPMVFQLGAVPVCPELPRSTNVLATFLPISLSSITCRRCLQTLVICPFCPFEAAAIQNLIRMQQALGLLWLSVLRRYEDTMSSGSESDVASGGMMRHDVPHVSDSQIRQISGSWRNSPGSRTFGVTPRGND